MDFVSLNLSMMDRDELWWRMIEADGNARYYGSMQGIYRKIDGGVKFLLIASTAGGLVGLFCTPVVGQVLTIIAFVAALLEVVIKPVVKWDETEKVARTVKEAWIDIRVQYEDLWRKLEHEKLDVIDASNVLLGDTATEKKRVPAHVYQIQWLINMHIKRADESMTRAWS